MARPGYGLGVNGLTRIVTDGDGRIVDAAEGAGRLLAIDDRWLVGRPLAAFVAASQRRDFRTLLLDLSHGGGPRVVSLKLQRRDGVPLAVEARVVAEEGDGRIEWLLAHTEPPGTEPPHGLKPVPLRRLLARLPVGIVSFASDLTVEYANPAARVYLDGARVGSLLPDPWPEFSLRKFARRLFGSSPPVRQLAETAGGRLLELDGIAGGESESALLLLQDVTSRERGRRAEREFVSNAAHELRTPIAAISSALEVLQSGAKDDPADRDLFLDHVERESDRLARLVEALLLLARIQMGQETPVLELVDVAPLLDGVAAEVTPAGGVRVRVDCGAGVAVLADPDLLHQAVWNIVANAARHTSRGEIELLGRDLGQYAEIEVRDTGSGISPDQQRHVFERFYRAERQSGRGAGLGLPISLEIARALGGNLTLDSAAGRGTRVRMHVPSARVVQA
jgi:two-component system phosphate regulon sensor histidine kinase PhoR